MTLWNPIFVSSHSERNGTDTVTIDGTAATATGSNCFYGLVTLTPGTTGTVSIVATDSGGNSRTNHYQTTALAQPSYTPTYDNDGNELTTGAGQAYTWDVKSELVTIAQASGTSQFTFDALGHRISEKVNGTLTKQWVWDGDTLAEERNASNTVTKRFYPQGEQISGTTYYYTRDHLGSIREMTTGTSGTIVARYDYDPYGRATQLQGALASDFQYAGYYLHAASGLYFPVHRPYDPIIDRWPSRDPLGEEKTSLMPSMGQYIQPNTGMPGRPTELPISVNLYEYALNDPLYWTDPLGLNVINLNFSFGFFDLGGQWDINGFHPYAGLGLGAGASVTLNPDENSTVECHRWSGNPSAALGLALGVSKDFDEPGSPGSWSWNYGLGTPGAGMFWNYTGK